MIIFICSMSFVLIDGEPGRTGRGSVTSNANKPVKRKQKRLERCLVFGEAPLPDPRTFLGIIHAVCWNTINDGLNFAEEYHRLRGSRAITRPGLIPETFETTADKLSQKMLNYLTQSEQFALVLMHKFRDLSNSIMDLTVKLVPYLLRRLLVAYREEVALKQRLVKDRFELDSKRVCDLRQVRLQFESETQLTWILCTFWLNSKKNFKSEQISSNWLILMNWNWIIL